MGSGRALVALGDEISLRFECGGCGRGASVERSEACMSCVIGALAEHPDADVVVLADAYEREYRGDCLAVLKGIAEISRRGGRWARLHLCEDGCERCESERKQQFGHVSELLLRDPIRAGGELEALIRELDARARHGAEKCRRCRRSFIDQVLGQLLSSLRRAGLAAGGGRGGRRTYAELLRPLIRPRLLGPLFTLEPPAGARLVDAYGLDGGEVRIYHLPDQLQHFYLLVPKECLLRHEHVSLLSRARQVLLDRRPELAPAPSPARERLERLGADLIAELAAEQNFVIGEGEAEELAHHLIRLTAGLGLIETLLEDERVQDVYIDAPVGRTPVHLYHRDYEECVTNIRLTAEDASAMASRFRALSGRPFSEAEPVLDLSLNGVRVTALEHPLSPDGLAFAFRRHRSTPWTLPQFVRARFLTPHAAGLLSLLVGAQASILVTGNRGAGKTSLLGALMLELLPRTRVILIEDTPEIPVEHLRSLGFKVQSLRARSPVAGAGSEFRAEDALRAALRLGESVLVLGEVRGPEAKVLYEAMRIGATGNSVMGTIHGASARDVYERVVHDLGVPPSSFKAADVIIVASTIRPGGGIAKARRVTRITEIGKGADPAREGLFRDLMTYSPAEDGLIPTRWLRRSELIRDIARRWGVEVSDVIENLELRARIQEAIVRAAVELDKPQALESEFVVRSNLTLHGLLEEQLRCGRVDYGEVFRGWRDWLEAKLYEVRAGPARPDLCAGVPGCG